MLDTLAEDLSKRLAVQQDRNRVMNESGGVYIR